MTARLEARYLRVKNWPKHQHYRDRRPPWIKLHNDVLNETEGAWAELSELEQWQLVRLWVRFSLSESTVPCTDPEYMGRDVPIIAYDEPRIRLAIKSLKPVPLARFVRLGLLEELSAEEVDALRASTALAPGASTDASKTGDLEAPGARKPPLYATEVSEELEQSKTEQLDCPDENGIELLERRAAEIEAEEKRRAANATPCDELVAVLDEVDDGTPRVIQALLDQLPAYAVPATIYEINHPSAEIRTTRTAYAVKALQAMVEKSKWGRSLHRHGRALEAESRAA